MNMRIGFDVTPLSIPRTGVGTYTACLLACLQEKEDAIIPLSHRPPGPNGSTAGNDAPPSGPNKTLWMQFMIQKQIKEAGLDLCHFTNHVAPLRAPCPTILTIHDMTLWLQPSFHPLRRLAAMRPVIPLAARRAAAVIAVSESTKADIVRLLNLPAQKVNVVYEAPDPVFRRPMRERELHRVGQTYSLPPHFLLHVGTLEPRKNLVRLVQAFATLREGRHLPHHLVLVGGKGWKFQEIFRAVEAHGLHETIHFLDYVPKRDLPAIYRLAAALVFPSIYEGFGLPLVEAMASGTPLIVSTGGALPEVAGDAAVYLNPQSIAHMAETIWQTVTDRDLLADLSAKGSTRSRLFSWQKAADQTRQIYRQVLSGSFDRPAGFNTLPSFTAGDEQVEI